MPGNLSTPSSPSLRLYSVRALWIATFLGSPLAAGILLRKNFIGLGEAKKGTIALWLGILSTILLFGSLFVLPEAAVEKIPNQIIPLLYTAGIYFAAKHYQGKALEAHQANGGAFYSAWNAAGVGALCLIGIFVVIFAYVFIQPTTYDTARYEEGMAKFSANEEEALTLYASLGAGETEGVNAIIQQKGIPAWQQNIQILKEMDAIEHLPAELQEQNKLLYAYCQLRLEVYALIDKALVENTDQYDARIEAKHAEIEAILDQLQ